MKIKYIAFAVILLTVLVGCAEDHRNDNLYDSAVYFVNNATAGVKNTETMYDVQESLDYPVYVYCSGYYGGTTDVSMAVDESFITLYNETNSTELLALPSDCYELTTTRATIKDRKATMSVKFNVSALKALSNEDDFSDLENYVVPLVLTSNGDIPVSEREDNMLGYELVHPVLERASVAFSVTEDVTVSGLTYTMTMKTLFDNSFNVAWNVEFESASFEAQNATESTSRGNSIEAKYAMKALPLDAITNADVKSLAAGENQVEYTITMPEGTPYGKYYLHVTVNGATLDGQSIPIESGDVDADIVFEYMPSVTMGNVSTSGSVLSSYMTLIPQSDMTFKAESYQSGNPPANAIDGDVSNMWENRWGSNGVGVYTIPIIGIIDLGSQQTVNVIEVWRRSGSYVTDLRTFEVYAAEMTDYSDVENMTYSGLTYLGNVDFGSDTDVAKLTMLDEATTRYLVLKFTASNRNGSCISIADMCLWHR